MDNMEDMEGAMEDANANGADDASTAIDRTDGTSADGSAAGTQAAMMQDGDDVPAGGDAPAGGDVRDDRGDRDAGDAGDAGDAHDGRDGDDGRDVDGAESGGDAGDGEAAGHGDDSDGEAADHGDDGGSVDDDEGDAADASDADDAAEDAGTAGGGEAAEVSPSNAGAPDAVSASQGAGWKPYAKTAVAACVALVAGIAIGFAAKPAQIPQPVGSESGLEVVLSGENALDTVVATYYSGGEVRNITARQAIEDAGSVEGSDLGDGSYRMPSADAILSCARNRILYEKASAEGYGADDDEILKYAKDTVGTDDMEALASEYSMSADQIREILGQSATISKLYEKIAGESGKAPEAPDQPAVGKETEETTGYLDYIIAVAGNDWDASAKAPKSGTSYATALDGADFSDGKASYSEAEAAYYTAYQEFGKDAEKRSSAWTGYVNGLLSEAAITINTLVS